VRSTSEEQGVPVRSTSEKQGVPARNSGQEHWGVLARSASEEKHRHEATDPLPVAWQLCGDC